MYFVGYSLKKTNCEFDPIKCAKIADACPRAE
jgi:hypothetical protein